MKVKLFLLSTLALTACVEEPDAKAAEKVAKQVEAEDDAAALKAEQKSIEEAADAAAKLVEEETREEIEQLEEEFSRKP